MIEKHSLDYSKIENNADQILSFFNMVFNLYYKYPLQEIIKSNCMEVFTNRILEEFQSEEVKKQTKKVLEYTKEFLEKNK